MRSGTRLQSAKIRRKVALHQATERPRACRDTPIERGEIALIPAMEQCTPLGAHRRSGSFAGRKAHLADELASAKCGQHLVALLDNGGPRSHNAVHDLGMERQAGL